MIRIQVSINEEKIHDLTAINKGPVLEKPDSPKHQWRQYELNCSHKLLHDRKKGALCLMIQMAGHAEMCRLQ